MCGISGIAFTRAAGKVVDAALLTRMRDALTHRGPDDKGIFIDQNIGLAHRRLSIVDVAGGHQPMQSADGSVVVTYNGEIYNHAEHRPELSERGCVFRTKCDTETLVYLYQEFGAECVPRLRGMFAIAVWDTKRRELFIARDRLGVKPLYYVHNADGDLFFASEIKALIAANGVKPELNYAALGDYLANHSTTGEDTLFLGVKRLLPGHAMTWKDGKLTVTKYWDLAFEPKLNGRVRSTKDWVDEWRHKFTEAVRLRLMADVPLGMFLSGGIDSSAIAAVMSQLVAEPIKTFSVAFAEREANELEYARLAADAFKTDHHEVVVSSEQFFGALPNLIWHEDEPLAHPSSVALNFVSRLAAEKVKVVLTGEGSDESLAGYGRYAKTLLNLRLGNSYQKFTPVFARSAIAAGIGRLPIDSAIRHKLRKSFFSVAPTIEDIYFDNFAVFSRSTQEKMLTQAAKDRVGVPIDPYQEMSALFKEADAKSALDRMLYTDTKTYLHELLMKQDQMSMAASIESRVPFLDHELVELTARMPDTLKLQGRTTKFVLREAMKDLLPDRILARPKMGFPVPVGKWFRADHKELIDRFVLSERALQRGIFEPDAVREIADRHQRGEDHDEQMWSLLNFELWQRIFLDGESRDDINMAQA